MVRLSLLFLLLPQSLFALEPNEIFLITNRNEPHSKRIAEHYCQSRKVPKEHILEFDLPKTEDISRANYDAKLVAPLREKLKEKKAQAKVLLTIYGVPLRVGNANPTAEQLKQIQELEAEVKTQQAAIRRLEVEIDRLMKLQKTAATDAQAEDLRLSQKELDAVKRAMQKNLNQIQSLKQVESQAAVDSELMLLWAERYQLTRWQINRLNWQVPAKHSEAQLPTIMTCRLDGPSPDLVKQLIDDSVAVEKKGLTGKVYVDARGIGFKFDPKSDIGYGYGGYDESFREMATLLKSAKFDVILDDQNEVFKEKSCPDAALYCGWYSHGNFVDSNRFVRGAVAWHLASSEAISLRTKDSKLWCKNLLEKGAVATLGPVAEPYAIGFPKPAEFFGFLATGKYTLVECYAKTTHFSSWMMTLVGDPLYNPFRESPRLNEDQIKPSPKQGRFLLNVKD